MLCNQSVTPNREGTSYFVLAQSQLIFTFCLRGCKGIGRYSGEGKILGQAGVAEFLEVVAILLFWFSGTLSKVYAQASATPACPNTSLLH